MPALPADIIRATRSARIVIRSDSAVKTMFPAARDGQTSPDPGFFENVADAEAVLDIKADLIAEPRQRYVVTLAEELWIDPTVGVPSFQLIDTELGVDRPVMLTRLEVDMQNETTTIEVIG